MDYGFIQEIIDSLVDKAIKLYVNHIDSLNIKTPNEIVKSFLSMSITETNDYIANLQYFGKVLHFTEGFLVVKPALGAPLLELETKVALESGKVIGTVDDIIGNVDNPHYVVQAYCVVSQETDLYFQQGAPVLTSISTKPGTDASNRNDEETDQSESDDEAPSKKEFSILRPPLD